MFYPQHPKVDKLNLCITTACSRSCPDCCVGVGRVPPTYMSLAEIQVVGKLMGPLTQVQVTGGEPTIHPQFVEVSMHLREMFDAREFWLATNGYGVRGPQRFEAFTQYDRVLVTQYGPETYEGCTSNESEVHALVTILQNASVELVIGHQRHRKPKHLGAGQPCGRGRSGRVSYWNGKLYPCSSSHGVEGTTGVALSGGWREDIMKIPLACPNCAMARYPDTTGGKEHGISTT